MRKVLTIFGATGNLMHKKLAPALLALMESKDIDDSVEIVLVSRRDFNNDMYFDHLKAEVSSSVPIEKLRGKYRYVAVDIHSPSSYENLKSLITSEVESEYLFYLAVAPELFVDITKGLFLSGLIQKGNTRTRIVFEKPFGEDFDSAKDINEQLSMMLDEKQIYRIDHYLGKDMIQNLLVLRFANRLFEHTWSSEDIESVDIIVKETETIKNRAAYYDHTGALKDMVQSHLLQMLAYIAMEQPASMSTTDIRKQKIDVLKKVSFDSKSAVFGQYEGYLSEKGVAKFSTTETYVSLVAKVTTPRWKNVPFRLVTGKKLDEKKAQIVINYKNHSAASSLFQNEILAKNQLIIGVSDYEGISIQVHIKRPGMMEGGTDALLDYCHSCVKIGNNPEAYTKLLKDFLDGKDGQFTSWDEIVASWEAIETIVRKRIKLIQYRNIDDLSVEKKVEAIK